MVVFGLPCQASGSWEIEWTAPSAGAGTVDFYFAGNAANQNGSTSGDYIYTINVTVPEQILGVADFPVRAPENHTLISAYPNPFNPTVTLNLESIPAGSVKLEVLNTQGQVLTGMELVSSGNNALSVPLNLVALPSGLYFVRATHAGGTVVKPLTKLK